MTKLQICIKNLCINNIPVRSNRIFLKFKVDRYSIYTKKYKISNNNSVSFDDMISMPYNSRKVGNQYVHLRFSFRIEKSNGINYKRYGAFDITDFDLNAAKEHPYSVCRSLDNCKEKPQIECKIIVLDYSSQSLAISKARELSEGAKIQQLRNEQSEPIFNMNSKKIPSLSDISTKSEPGYCSRPMLPDIDNHNDSCSYPRSKSLTLPIKISNDKYKEIETQIDNILANIINDNSQ